jgi:hypothetical protein
MTPDKILEKIYGKPTYKQLETKVESLTAERDEAAQINRDLAMLVRRLIQRCNSSQLIEQAADYLRRKNLQGSPLR